MTRWSSRGCPMFTKVIIESSDLTEEEIGVIRTAFEIKSMRGVNFKARSSKVEQGTHNPSVQGSIPCGPKTWWLRKIRKIFGKAG